MSNRSTTEIDGRKRAYFLVVIEFVDGRTHHTVRAATERFEGVVFGVDCELAGVHHEVVSACTGPSITITQAVSGFALGRAEAG